jgi:hypothetical protein
LPGFKATAVARLVCNEQSRAFAGICDLSGTLRDFKKFTGKKIIEAIIPNEHESRKEWMIPIFKEAGKQNSRNTDCQFWRQDNQPKECYSPGFTIQKLNYIHNNRLKLVSWTSRTNICTAVQEIIIARSIVGC